MRCSRERVSVFPPYGDPEHRSLGPDQPEGTRDGSRVATEGQGRPFCRPRFEARSAGLRAPFGRPFFWILFFGRAKKSISPAGRDPHSTSRRVSGTIWREPWLAPQLPKRFNR
jgi:hypothetical protein